MTALILAARRKARELESEVRKGEEIRVYGKSAEKAILGNNLEIPMRENIRPIPVLVDSLPYVSLIHLKNSDFFFIFKYRFRYTLIWNIYRRILSKYHQSPSYSRKPKLFHSCKEKQKLIIMMRKNLNTVKFHMILNRIFVVL